MISVAPPTFQRPLTRDDVLWLYGPLGIGWIIAIGIVIAQWRRGVAKDRECAAERKQAEERREAERRRHESEMARVRDRHEERLVEIYDALRDVVYAAEEKITPRE